MFVDFGIKDAIDVLLVALLLYNLYKLTKESGAINIFTGILTFIGVWVVVTQILDMRLMGSILNKLISVGVVVIVILFQDEIRRFLVELGSKRWRFFFKYFLPEKKNTGEKPYILPIVLACNNMSKNKEGALIVIQREMPLTIYEKSGDTINADINSRLIENIFFKNSPLHDGAMIIGNNRIVAAGCILPISHNNDIPKSLGLRHRAAIGLTQECDALVVIVSEETGNISVAMNGKLHVKLSAKDLENFLSKNTH